MPFLKFFLIITCLLLSACQTTSIREITASESNTAKKEQNNTTQLTGENYPEKQENHLRMYVFTSHQKSSDKEAERDGYFIDFKTAAKASNQVLTKE